MTTFKTALQQDANKLTKTEIVDLLTDLHDTIGADAFGTVTGLDIKDELPDLKKAEIVSVMEDFRDQYDEGWDAAAVAAGRQAFNRVADIAAADAALFSSSNVSSANFAAELGSIDFANLIGGPMQAAVQAQAAASMSTVRFINEVGFDRNAAGEITGIKMVDFSYTRQVPDPNDNTQTIDENVNINVPFISILNVPSLRIETLDIDFNVKLNSTYTNKVESTFDTEATMSYGGKWFSPVKFEASIAYQRKSATGTTIEKEYSMGVKVKATNDEMPAGLEKVLGLLAA